MCLEWAGTQEHNNRKHVLLINAQVFMKEGLLLGASPLPAAVSSTTLLSIDLSLSSM